MHFYDWNIGDYAKKTQHLTNEEDIAYRRALDMYYDTEKPLETQNIPLLSRRLRVSLDALENVLKEFFPDGKNRHADEKIAAYYAFIEKQKLNGKLGGRPKKTQAFPTDNPSQTQYNPSQTQYNPTPSQPLPTKPLPTNHNKTLALFAQFWDSYPKKKGKGSAESAWKKIKTPDIELIILSIEKEKQSDQWKKDGGQFIPFPATWLNQRRWEDDSISVTPSLKKEDDMTQEEKDEALRKFYERIK